MWHFLLMSLTSLAKATSSALFLKSPSKMDPTIVRPRPKKQTFLKDKIHCLFFTKSLPLGVQSEIKAASVLS